MSSTDHRKRELNGIIAICTGVALPLAIAVGVASDELSRVVGGIAAAASWTASLFFLMRS